MKGSKTKIGTKAGLPKWRLRVFLGRDADGVQRFESKTIVASARDADRELGKMIELAHPGGSSSNADTRRRTFSAALALWRTKDAPRKSPTTVRGYESNLALHVLDKLGEVPVNRITPRTIANLLDELTASGLKPATVNNVQTVISAVLQRAHLEEWIPHNPARSIRRAPIAWRPPTSPENDDLAKLLGAIDDEDDRALVVLAIVTAARRSELVALRWSDLKGSKLTIERSLVVGKTAGAPLVEKSTKTHAVRTLELPKRALDVLRARRARAERYAASLRVKVDPDGFVFSDEPRCRAPWRPELVSHRWDRVRKRAGLDAVRFHDLRHFAISDAIANGADPAAVRDWVGHRSLDTTNLYAHSRADAFAGIALRADATLGAILES